MVTAARFRAHTEHPHGPDRGSVRDQRERALGFWGPRSVTTAHLCRCSNSSQTVCEWVGAELTEGGISPRTDYAVPHPGLGLKVRKTQDCLPGAPSVGGRQTARHVLTTPPGGRCLEVKGEREV